MNLNRTGSVWNRENRNGINRNWGEIEDGLNALNSFTEGFDGSKLLERTANLFNKNEAGYGSIELTTGTVNDDTFRNTGFIAVDPDTTYRMNPTMGVGAMYDRDYNYIGPISTAGDTIRTTDDTRFVRVSVSASQIDTTMFYKGSEYKTYEPYGFKPAPLIIDNSGRDALTINQGSVYPLKLYQLGSGSLNIPELHKNAVLDAKVFGAIPGKVYRLAMVSNGYVLSSGETAWGVTITETNKDGSSARVVSNYHDHPGTRGSTGIDTIIQGNDEMMFSVTVDRKVISDSSIPTHMNTNTAPNVIIDPSNYSF